MQPDAQADHVADGAEQQGLEVGAAHGVGVLADPLHERSEAEVAEGAAVTVAVAEPPHVAADGGDGRAQPEGVEHLHAVRPEGDAGADRAQAAGAFQDLHLLTGALEGERGGQPADPGSDDDDLEVLHPAPLVPTPVSRPSVETIQRDRSWRACACGRLGTHGQ